MSYLQLPILDERKVDRNYDFDFKFDFGSDNDADSDSDYSDSEDYQSHLKLYHRLDNWNGNPDRLLKILTDNIEDLNKEHFGESIFEVIAKPIQPGTDISLYAESIKLLLALDVKYSDSNIFLSEIKKCISEKLLEKDNQGNTFLKLTTEGGHTLLYEKISDYAC